MKMKNLKYIILSVFACLSLSSCDLLLPGSIVNPNVSDDTFLESDNAMQAWVNGANRSFAVTFRQLFQQLFPEQPGIRYTTYSLYGYGCG